jgi:malonyl-CoA/methylmalonyl-CoA synthetase
VTATTELLVERIPSHGARLAVLDPDGAHDFAELDAAARALARRLLLTHRTSAELPPTGPPPTEPATAAPTAGDARPSPPKGLDGARVAILCRPGHEFVVALLGCWLAGGLAVPLHPEHPTPELAHVLEDAEATVLLTVASLRHKADELAAAVDGVVAIDVAPDLAAPSERTAGASPDAAPGDPSPALPTLHADSPALMVYTSGTTGRPKGAVHTHGSVAAQVRGMVELWEWRPDDRILLVLPLHHVHGIVNVVLCALWCGAVCEAPRRFDAVATWERLASGELTLFMAVPTIYARLVAAWEAADDTTRRRWSEGAARLRLMVSGSAALPVEVLDRWEAITGHRLLERYGMTELGMVLSNRLDARVPGHVGFPFPGVEVRVVGEDGRDVPDGEAGELLVAGPQTFRGYWRRPDATADAFVDGWFRTGDVAVRTPDGYRLLGRDSVDILKTGGEKVSALEIEATFRRHPAVAECAVVGLPDAEWGQRVAIAVVPRAGAELPGADELRAWGKERLAPAKVPTRWQVVDDLPRNAMGKVTKPAVAAAFDAG